MRSDQFQGAEQAVIISLLTINTILTFADVQTIFFELLLRQFSETRSRLFKSSFFFPPLHHAKHMHLND